MMHATPAAHADADDDIDEDADVQRDLLVEEIPKYTRFTREQLEGMDDDVLEKLVETFDLDIDGADQRAAAHAVDDIELTGVTTALQKDADADDGQNDGTALAGVTQTADTQTGDASGVGPLTSLYGGGN